MILRVGFFLTEAAEKNWLRPKNTGKNFSLEHVKGKIST
jgi:hypothetical protein